MKATRVPVYIAGPYSASTPQGILNNVETARNYAKTILDKTGYAVIVPHAITAHFEFDKRFSNWDFNMWMERQCLPLLSVCKAIVIIPGYEKSTGTLIEMEFAKANNIPIYHFKDLFDGEHE